MPVFFFFGPAQKYRLFILLLLMIISNCLRATCKPRILRASTCTSSSFYPVSIQLFNSKPLSNPIPCLSAPQFPRNSPFRSFTSSQMPPKKSQGSNGVIEDNAHQFQAGDTTHRKEDEWKHREPYKIHDSDEEFDVKWKGGCHCGKTKYELSRDKPLASKYCHCTTCQRLHGSPFQWATIFHKEDINFTNGIHDLGWYDPTNKDVSHHLPCKVSCAYCRTPIMDEGRNMILLFPTLIEGINKKEAREAFKPSCHMFYNQRVVDFKDDGVVKWEGLDNQSNLLDDDGNVIVKYEKGMDSKAMDEKKRKYLELGENDEVKAVKEQKI